MLRLVVNLSRRENRMSKTADSRSASPGVYVSPRLVYLGCLTASTLNGAGTVVENMTDMMDCPGLPTPGDMMLMYPCF